MEPGLHSLVMTVDAVGGIWTYALDLGRELVGRGVDVTFAIVGPGAPDRKRGAAIDAGIELVDLGSPPEWLAARPVEVARGGEALAQLAREVEADLIHLNHPAFAADVRFGRPVLGVCHSCVATWWDAVKGTPLPETFGWQAELVGRGYRAATHLVAPSRAFASVTQRAYALSEAPTAVHNGRAVGDVAAATREPMASAFTAGRLWDEGKNAATLDRVAALTAVPISAAGPTEGPNGTAIAFTHVKPLGLLPDEGMRRLLAGRPVYVSAALYEPFGLSVLEAAQAGCALVLSDIESLRELWEGAAVFVPARDAAGFAAAIDRLIADPALRAQFADAARVRAAAYALPAFADRMLEVYAGAMAGAAEARGGAA